MESQQARDTKEQLRVLQIRGQIFEYSSIFRVVPEYKLQVFGRFSVQQIPCVCLLLWLEFALTSGMSTPKGDKLCFSKNFSNQQEDIQLFELPPDAVSELDQGSYVTLRTFSVLIGTELR